MIQRWWRDRGRWLIYPGWLRDLVCNIAGHKYLAGASRFGNGNKYVPAWECPRCNCWQQVSYEEFHRMFGFRFSARYVR